MRHYTFLSPDETAARRREEAYVLMDLHGVWERFFATAPGRASKGPRVKVWVKAAQAAEPARSRPRRDLNADKRARTKAKAPSAIRARRRRV